MALDELHLAALAARALNHVWTNGALGEETSPLGLGGFLAEYFDKE